MTKPNLVLWSIANSSVITIIPTLTSTTDPKGRISNCCEIWKFNTFSVITIRRSARILMRFVWRCWFCDAQARTPWPNKSRWTSVVLRHELIITLLRTRDSFVGSTSAVHIVTISSPSCIMTKPNLVLWSIANSSVITVIPTLTSTTDHAKGRISNCCEIWKLNTAGWSSWITCRVKCRGAGWVKCRRVGWSKCRGVGRFNCRRKSRRVGCGINIRRSFRGLSFYVGRCYFCDAPTSIIGIPRKGRWASVVFTD